jgi:hypothetical protein
MYNQIANLPVNQSFYSRRKAERASLLVTYLLADAGIYLDTYRWNGLAVAQLARAFYVDRDYALMRAVRSSINAVRATYEVK